MIIAESKTRECYNEIFLQMWADDSVGKLFASVYDLLVTYVLVHTG